MLALPAVVLHHRTPSGNHFDWLLTDAAAPGGLLWALRGAIAPDTVSRRIDLTEMAPHRRRYLTYQGPISPEGGRHRGDVLRVDQATYLPRLWTRHRRVVELTWRRAGSMVLDFRLIHGPVWCGAAWRETCVV